MNAITVPITILVNVHDDLKKAIDMLSYVLSNHDADNPGEAWTIDAASRAIESAYAAVNDVIETIRPEATP